MRSGLLAQCLAKRGHEIVWWASNFDHLTKKKVLPGSGLITLEPGLSLRYLSSLSYSNNISVRRYLDHLVYANKFARAARKEPVPNLIIASTPDYHLAYEGLLYAEEHQIPFVLDVRDPWPDSFLEVISHKFSRKLLKLLLRSDFNKLAKLIQSANGITSMMDSLLEWALNKTVHPVANRVFHLGATSFGLNLKDFEERKNWGKNHDFNVAFIGSFGTLQNPRIIVDAAAIIEHKHPELSISFIIAGDGPMRAQIEKSAKGSKNINFYGWVNEEEIKTILLKSHLGVIPENLNQDTFPNKTFTYLSGGLPLLSGSEGELRRFMAQNSIGRGFDSNSPESLANQIVDIYHKPLEWQRLQTNALNIFEGQFNADKIYSEFSDWIENICKNTNSNGGVAKSN